MMEKDAELEFIKLTGKHVIERYDWVKKALVEMGVLNS